MSRAPGATRLSAAAGAALLLLACAPPDPGGPLPPPPPPDPPRAPTVLLPDAGVRAEQLAVVVNVDDPLSVAIGAAYVQARGIAHVVEVALPAGVPVISGEQFAPAKAAVDDLPDDVQMLALAWTQPYGVGCMSITSAFALGFDEGRFCRSNVPPCQLTETVPTFDDDSHAPYTDHGIRPAMLLAGVELADVEALIERGVAADASFPTGRGFLVQTSDAARAVRSPAFPAIVAEWQHEGGLELEHVVADFIEDEPDVLFYFTGLVDVPALATNSYRPGAVADHLTSFGGQVPESLQMSILRWLEAGATASYGTVVEPCNFPQKFPDPAVLLRHYFRGEPLLEAYWKSVAAPGEGLFIGEPLARPWGPDEVLFDPATKRLTIATNGLIAGRRYVLDATRAFYRLTPL
jgi:uncharacterized protein (TIGR03790 family)